MNNSKVFDIKSTNLPIKQCIEIGNSWIIKIDKSIVQKLQISEDTFLEQELTDDGILMRIKKINEIN